MRNIATLGKNIRNGGGKYSAAINQSVTHMVATAKALLSNSSKGEFTFLPGVSRAREPLLFLAPPFFQVQSIYGRDRFIYSFMIHSAQNVISLASFKFC